MLPSDVTMFLTLCLSKNACIRRLILGLFMMLVPTQRSSIGSAPSRVMTPATIFVVV